MNIGIITGASSGMGRLFAFYAKYFYPELDELWLISRDIKKLSRVSFKLDISSTIFPIDITTDNGIDIFIKEIKEKRPNIRLLVNSAGMGIIGKFETLDISDIHNMVSLNCESLSKIIRICLDYMDKGASIINLASAAAFVAQPEFQVYAASKSYVKSLSAALYKELKSKGISVTAVCPGCVATPFFNVAQKYNKIKSYKKIFMAKDKNVVIKAFKDAQKRKMYSVYGIPMKIFMIICKILPSRIIMMFM